MTAFALQRQNLNSWNRDPLALKAENIYYLAHYRKSNLDLINR